MTPETEITTLTKALSYKFRLRTFKTKPDIFSKFGYLTESLHGVGSPPAQRIQIARRIQLDFKKQPAKELAGIEKRKRERSTAEIADYFGKVFDTDV